MSSSFARIRKLMFCLFWVVASIFNFSGFAARAGSSIGKIAYFKGDLASGGSIFVMNTDGTNQQNISRGTMDAWPNWSPDGRQIAYQSERGGHAQIYVMSADGSHQRNISNSVSDDLVPSWSPDGRQIAFYSNRDGLFQIFVMSADGSD